mmetsp:Transcript_26186/g.44174  ORF Transcript_26186/g.44174 Transcript_26186/m.44174 type:complete len:209 (-) Transcript_26186:215-841(-)
MTAKASSLMGKVVALIKASFLKDCKGETTELSRVVLLQPIFDLHLPANMNTCDGNHSGSGSDSPVAGFSLPSNVRLCAAGSADASLDMNSAFDEAKSIFEYFCPGKDFTCADIDEAAAAAKAQGRGGIDNDEEGATFIQKEEDDEATYLEFALNAVTSTSAVVATAEAEAGKSIESTPVSIPELPPASISSIHCDESKVPAGNSKGDI